MEIKKTSYKVGGKKRVIWIIIQICPFAKNLSGRILAPFHEYINVKETILFFQTFASDQWQ